MGQTIFGRENQTHFKAENKFPKRKFMVLDMFPYPLVLVWARVRAIPLGLLASDIYARYKRT